MAGDKRDDASRPAVAGGADVPTLPAPKTPPPIASAGGAAAEDSTLPAPAQAIPGPSTFARPAETTLPAPTGSDATVAAPLASAATMAAPLDSAATMAASQVSASASASRPVSVVRPPRDSQSIERGTTIGRYVVVGKLGAGGMGVVYAAYDPDLNRRVALKLVQALPGDDSTGGTIRMQREAQALARLSHPNVVGIYDVGTIGDRVFLAMELVDGESLAEWLKAERRTWRECVAVFLQAGRGLAAAHAADVIHRDFKPGNVVVGTDGRVRVLDFGLARAVAAAPEPEEPAARASARDLLGADLTVAGAIMGTPLYMPPEARRGEVVTAAGDQFSFCVALYEALYHQRPFVAFQEPLPPVPPPPADTDVPAWVHRVVVRGLAAKREDRFASMDELLSALEADPAIKRRKWMLAGAAITAAGGFVAGGVYLNESTRDNNDPCAIAAPLAGAWDAAARVRVETRFASVGGADAAAAFGRAASALDETAAEWSAARRDACADTRQRRTESEAALVLRLECLDRQKQDLGALVQLFEQADAAIVKNAAQAIHNLPGPVLCANVRSLSYVAPPPAIAAAKVAELRQRKSGANALLLAGKEEEAGVQLRAIVDDARAVGYQPLLAEALHLRARQELDHDESLRLLDEAEMTALAGRADSIGARAATSRLRTGVIVGKPEPTLMGWLDRAQAWVQRDADPEAEFVLEQSRGLLAANRGDNAAEEQHLRRAIELGTRLFGAAGTRVFGVQSTLAFTLTTLGRYDESIRMMGPAIEMFERTYGTGSVRLPDALDSYGLALAMVGRYAEARKALERGLTLSPSKSLTRAATLCDLSRVALAEDKVDEAIELADQGLALFKELEVEGMNLAANMDPLARAYAAAGRHADASAQSRACLAEFAKGGNEGVETVACRTLEGAALVGLDRAKEALPVLERALEIQSGHPAAPGVIANIKFQLARAVVATGGDRERARSLAAAAHDELARHPFLKRTLDTLAAWRIRNGL